MTHTLSNDTFNSQVSVALEEIQDMRKSIGIIPPLGRCECTIEAEKSEYSRINWTLVGRNKALESMLHEAKKELESANKTMAQLRTAIARYENRINQEMCK